MADYIVTKEQIDNHKSTDKTHYLNPNARRKNISLGDMVGLTGLGFHIIEVAPGCESTEYHLHYFEDECVYILSGTAEVTIGEMVYPVKAGDFIGYKADGLAHSMKNTGTELLRCIVAGQRLAHDVVDYAKQNKRLFRNQGRKWNLVNMSAIKYPEAGKK
jgi:uncharacterized cupin superfamily protein